MIIILPATLKTTYLLILLTGLLFGQGKKWRENRNAFMRAMWRASINEPYEAIINNEVDFLVSQFSDHLGSPLEIDTLLLPALSSRLVALLLGEPVPRDGEEMAVLLQQMRNLEEVDLTSKSTQMFLKVKKFR